MGGGHIKTRIIYICETCGNESENKDKILACEASHYGLTPIEKQEWDRIETKVMMLERADCKTNSRNSRDALDSAVTELLAFETAHGIIRTKRYGLVVPIMK